MADKNKELNDRHEPSGPEQGGRGETEGRVARALAVLRLLNDKNNPFSLPQMIDLAGRRAEEYRRWEQSETLIKDLAVRLSDGQEITVDQTDFASLCGLHFRNRFNPDAVLHVWKKADAHFPEVLLVSLALNGIGSNGYDYEKPFRNGQTLSLKVTRCADGQLYVSVDCTQPSEEKSIAAANRLHAVLPFVVPVAFALAKLRSALRRRALRPRAFASALVLSAVASVILNLILLGNNLTGEVNAPAGVNPMPEQAPAPSAAIREDAPPRPAAPPVIAAANARHGIRATDGPAGTVTQATGGDETSCEATASSPSSPALKKTGVTADRTARRSTAPTPATPVPTLSPPRVSPPTTALTSTPTPSLTTEAAAKRVQDAGGQAAASAAMRNGSYGASAQPDSPKEIYVRIREINDDALRSTVQSAFVGALEQSRHFIVLSYDAARAKHEGMRVDIRYAPKKDCHGVILAEVYDEQGNLIWHDSKDCQNSAEGAPFQVASEALVKKMISALRGETQAGGDEVE